MCTGLAVIERVQSPFVYPNPSRKGVPFFLINCHLKISHNLCSVFKSVLLHDLICEDQTTSKRVTMKSSKNMWFRKLDIVRSFTSTSFLFFEFEKSQNEVEIF